MTAISASVRPYDTIDLSSRAFWASSAAQRESSFSVLRAERPVSWHPPVEDALIQDPSDPGFWAVTRRADIVAVSRTNEVFLSGNGVLFENVPAELLEASQSFLAMDPPRHTKLRKLVSAAFTPRQVRRIETRSRSTPRALSKSSGWPAAVSISSSTAPRNCPSAPCRTWWEFPKPTVSGWHMPPIRWSPGGPPLPEWSRTAGRALRKSDVSASGRRLFGRRAAGPTRR